MSMLILEGRETRVAYEKGETPPLGRILPCRRGHERTAQTVIWVLRKGQWNAQCRTCRKLRYRLRYAERCEDPVFRQKMRDSRKRNDQINRPVRRRRKLLNMVKDIRDFYEKFKLIYDGPPRHLPSELELFRTKFKAEELAEYVTPDKDSQELIIREVNSALAFEQRLPVHRVDLEKKLDALVDLVYVALGSAYLHGFDFEEAWKRVHASNMKKIRSLRKGDGANRGGQYDVVKPRDWTPPDLSDLVKEGTSS